MRSCTSQRKAVFGWIWDMLSWERHTDEDDSFQSMLFGDMDQWKSTVMFASHLTQKTHTNVNRTQSKCETLPKLLNTCLTKVTLRINAIQSQCKIFCKMSWSHWNNLFGAHYSRTKTNCIHLFVLWNSFPFLLMFLDHAGYWMIWIHS